MLYSITVSYLAVFFSLYFNYIFAFGCEFWCEGRKQVCTLRACFEVKAVGKMRNVRLCRAAGAQTMRVQVYFASPETCLTL